MAMTPLFALLCSANRRDLLSSSYVLDRSPLVAPESTDFELKQEPSAVLSCSH